MSKKKKKLYSVDKSLWRYFNERVAYWSGTLCSVDWQILVHKEVDPKPAARARYELFNACGYIHIYLNMLWDRKPTADEIDISAFHEVFESVYLSNFRWMAKAQCSFQVIEEETHRAMSRATNTIYQAMK